MPSRDDYLAMPVADRLARLARSPDDLAAAIAGRSDAELSRRAPGGWSAKETVCHLRDIEELCILRYHTMLAMDDPKVFVVAGPPHGDSPFVLSADRWAADRQYLRNDTPEALDAFRRRRGEVLAFLDALSPEQRQRGSIHPEHGRWTYEEFVAGVAGHDDNHLEQARGALSHV